ncbi:hypothetical protein [Methylocucumis oryzae]|uniref:Uncharacterized protein n=1 Tax=Methylocucumis oryzae TaxID=1632867 RepID=A0A0F3IN62_9GAMM|nr:hypothetical protein [Methylocucumis oryzae]KJV07998.1 hypothetical protein VZ94_00845 [Methylocucumis oryzae]
MKIIAQIPTSRRVGQGWSQEVTELLEVEVKGVCRHRCDAYRKRYYYDADVIPPPQILPDTVRMSMYRHKEGLFRVQVNRTLNKKWKPPKFEDGVNYVDV